MSRYCLILCPLVLNLIGCKRTPTDYERSKAIAIKSCKEVMTIAESPDYVKTLAQKVLDDWANNMVDASPVLIHAGHIRTQQDVCFLVLTMSDEDQDIVGLGIRETLRGAGDVTEVIEEEYPVFTTPGVGHFQLVAFKRRTEDQRKDEEAWSQYGSGANGKHSPPIWVSAPVPPGGTISVWVFDAAGHRSNEVPLERGLLRELATEQERATITEIFVEE